MKGIPPAAQAAYRADSPVTLFSLLRHEQKRTAVNFLFNLSSDYPNAIKAKEELIIQCGPRRLTINPLFSQGGNTPNDVHKVLPIPPSRAVSRRNLYGASDLGVLFLLYSLSGQYLLCLAPTMRKKGHRSH